MVEAEPDDRGVCVTGPVWTPLTRNEREYGQTVSIRLNAGDVLFGFLQRRNLECLQKPRYEISAVAESAT